MASVARPRVFPSPLCSAWLRACLLVFAMAVRDLSRVAGCRPWAAYTIACMAISAAGVGVFAFPHPLHNVFGMSELIGYQAPLAFALSWRRNPVAKPLVKFSWIMFIFLWVAIAMNMSSLDRHGALWEFLKPGYGFSAKSAVRGLVRLVCSSWG